MMLKRLIASCLLFLSATSVALAEQATGCAGTMARQTVAVNLTGLGNAVVVPHNGNKTIYLCAVNIGPSSAAVNLALVYGTQTTTPCDTGTTGLFAGTTAATGWNFAVNGGLTWGNGIGVIGMVPAGRDLCVFQSVGPPVPVGAIVYTQY